MSGNAALSAARKRRASSSPFGTTANTSSTQPNTSYYGGAKQTLQGIMNQQPYSSQSGGLPAPLTYTIPKELAPNIPINIYENIELIKQQLMERTKLIQTQGSSIPPEKLRVLHKQNEIQTQVLKQKMAIAQQMELEEQQKQQELHAQYIAQKQMASQIHVNPNEPEFIYEKGIPRKNPKFKKPEEIIQTKPITAIQNPEPVRREKMSHFTSIISDTGVIPPPIVILKSHDATLEEHHNIIKDMLSQLEELQTTIQHKSDQVSHIRHDIQNVSAGKNSAAASEYHNQEDDEQEENVDPEETELLMEVVMNDLTNSREFVEGIVDKIVNETNLSEVIMKIEPIIKENQELRTLIHSQQQMMNEMNVMLYRLLNQQPLTCTHTQNCTNNSDETTNDNVHEKPIDVSHIEYSDEGINCDGLYKGEMTEIILTPQVEDNTQLISGVHQETTHQDDGVKHGLHEEQHEEQHEPQHEPQHEEQHEEQHELQDEEPHEEEEPEYTTIDPNEDEYSGLPHFPEPISLVVSEL